MSANQGKESVSSSSPSKVRAFSVGEKGGNEGIVSGLVKVIEEMKKDAEEMRERIKTEEGEKELLRREMKGIILINKKQQQEIYDLNQEVDELKQGRVERRQSILKRMEKCSEREREESPLNHSEMIQGLKDDGFIKTNRVFEAMKAIDYKPFASKYPYENTGLLAENLEKRSKYLKKGLKVLVINCFHPYHIPCIALMVGDKGYIVKVTDDREEEDVLRMTQSSLFDSKRVTLVYEVNPIKRSEGYPPLAPYDLVFVFNETWFDSKAIEQQLSPGGKVVDPYNEAVFLRKEQ